MFREPAGVSTLGKRFRRRDGQLSQRIHDDIVDATTQALNYLREEPLLLPMSFGYSGLDERPEELDKEAIWEKVMLGGPITEAEFDRL
jgi:hypothetical protein